MPRRSKQEIQVEKAVDAAFSKHASGVQINIFDLSTIKNAGMKAGMNGESVEDAVRSAIQRLRKN